MYPCHWPSSLSLPAPYTRCCGGTAAVGADPQKETVLSLTGSKNIRRSTLVIPIPNPVTSPPQNSPSHPASKDNQPSSWICSTDGRIFYWTRGLLLQAFSQDTYQEALTSKRCPQLPLTSNQRYLTMLSLTLRSCTCLAIYFLCHLSRLCRLSPLCTRKNGGSRRRDSWGLFSSTSVGASEGNESSVEKFVVCCNSTLS